MKFLKEIAQIVNQSNPPKWLLYYGEAQKEDHLKSTIQLFYEQILQETFETDEEAAEALFEAAPSDPRYQKLKSKVRKRFINALFFVNQNQHSYTDYQSAYYACCREWAAAKILFGKSAREAGIAICHKVFKTALRYEFTELVLDCTRILRLHYGARSGETQKFEHYNQLFKQYEDTWRWENLAEERYTELMIYYVRDKSYKQGIHEQASLYYEELKPSFQKHGSAKLHMLGNLIQVIVLMSAHDYEGTIKVCQQAVQFFESKKFTHKTALNAFLYQQLVCHTQLREYEAGKKIAEKSLSYLECGSFNWFKCQELHFTLSLHTKNYEQALDIFIEVRKNKRFSFLALNVQEVWTIYEAYIYYLKEVNLLNPERGIDSLKPFRVGKFLNEVPIFSKDKRGLNIPILVIQILFLISRKKYDEAIDRIEAIEKYCSRYLRRNDTFRSNCFIKMLLQIPLSSFHKVGVQRRAKKYAEKLVTVPLEISKQADEVEIIPYEDLWEMALCSLALQFHQPGRRRMEG